MSASVHMQQPDDLGTAIRRRFVQIGLLLLLQAAILFGSAGRLDWWIAWGYLAI